MRKFIGTLSAILLYPYPDAAIGVFLLWLYWDNVWPKALFWWDGVMLSRTDKALQKNLNANVRAFYVHKLMQHRKHDRAEKAIFHRWRIKYFSSWKQFYMSTTRLTKSEIIQIRQDLHKIIGIGENYYDQE